jgi:hypothetical protein
MSDHLPTANRQLAMIPEARFVETDYRIGTDLPGAFLIGCWAIGSETRLELTRWWELGIQGSGSGSGSNLRRAALMASCSLRWRTS